MIKVAIIGTVGVPANYGGFETLVENIIGEYKSSHIAYTVYCSGRDMVSKLTEYKGAKLNYVPLKANGIQSIPYDIVSLIKATRGADIILILGVSGCVCLPIYRLFSKKKLIINIDGLEHRREKWGKMTRRFLKFSEKMAVKYGDVIVTDNKGITDYVKTEYGRESELIAYGGDHVLMDVPESESKQILSQYDLDYQNYSLALCRIEPENNVHTILEAYSRTPNKKLMFIGNWNKSAYGVKLKEKYAKYPNIKIQSAIYDLKTLNILRSNCQYYIHGHSAGGTNPSLVEAMFFGCPILCYNVVYNKESTQNKAFYWSNAEELIQLLQKNPMSGEDMLSIAEKEYTWKRITAQYEALY